jgi:hypothetical protein
MALEQPIVLADFDSSTRDAWLDHVEFTDRIMNELTGYCERVVLPKSEVPSQWRLYGRPVYHKCNVPLRSALRCTTRYPVNNQYTESADGGRDSFANAADEWTPSFNIGYERMSSPKLPELGPYDSDDEMVPQEACDFSAGYSAPAAAETLMANNGMLEDGQYAFSPLRTRRYPSENVQSGGCTNNKSRARQVVDGSGTLSGKAFTLQGRHVMTERAATAPTIATMDTNQGRRRRRRKRKAGMVGKGDSVTMSAKPDGGDGQVWTKKPCFAAVDDLNGHSSVLEKRNIEEALRLCDEADARTVLPIRVYKPATTEANDGKSAATAAVDDGFCPTQQCYEATSCFCWAPCSSAQRGDGQ